MKQLKLIGLVALLLTFSCESEEIREQRFMYMTSQDISSVQSFTIDFEEFNPGDIVSEIQLTGPLIGPEVSGITMAFPDDNSAMVFDSSNPTGGDFDIGTPNQQYGGPGRGSGGASNDTALGNVLILSEDLDSTDPDDIYEVGASFQFDFSTAGPVVMKSLDILDIEESNNPTMINLYGAKGELLFDYQVEPGGDNSKEIIDLGNTNNVTLMEIVMNSSGAIDNIAFDMEVEETCTDCDSSLAELSFRYTGSSDAEPIRIETSDGEVVFSANVSSNEEFSVSGNADDGSFTGSLLIFVNGTQTGTIATDCSQVIGPGFLLGRLQVIAGRTTLGGALCPVQVAF